MKLKITKYAIKDFIVWMSSHTVLLLVSVTCVFPLLWMFSSSLKTQQTIFKNMNLWPGVFHWENYVIAWTRGGFGMYFLNSDFYTVTVVVGLIIIASLAAYAFSRLKFRGSGIMYGIFLAAMMIPIPGAFVALYILLVKLGLVNTRLGYILPQINIGLSLAIYLLKTFFDEIPKEIEDSAMVDGCSTLGIWWHIALPLAKRCGSSSPFRRKIASISSSAARWPGWRPSAPTVRLASSFSIRLRKCGSSSDGFCDCRKSGMGRTSRPRQSWSNS